MVEQEHPTGSSAFPESLVSTSISQNFSSSDWFFNDTKPLTKSDELQKSDLLSNELLYGNALPNNEIPCSPISAEKDNLFQEKQPIDISSINDLWPCDLYCNDQNMSHIRDWNYMSGNLTGMLDLDYDQSPLSFWGSSPYDLETLKMDNIFQVDADDLNISPTLAELNAVDESILDTSAFGNFDTSILTDDKLTKSSLSAPVSNTESTYKLPSESETTQVKAPTNVASAKPNLLLFPTNTPKKEESLSTNEVKCNLSSEDNKIDSLSSPPMSKSTVVTDNGSEITKLVTKSHSANASSISADTKRMVKKPELSSLNHVTPDSDDDDSEMDCDYSSDVDEESEEETKVQSSKQASTNNLVLQKKKSRYFWQYNIQAKGPKAPKVKLAGKSIVDDHFSAVSDPIFTSSNLVEGIKHAGKARRGDGNDLTPNPFKLYNIGMELKKLNSVIEGLVPANELPLSARSKSRKEKNKLASRACRLKKKAQHEANKLKLFGLQKEQKQLTELVCEVKKIIKKSVENAQLSKVKSNVQEEIECISESKGIMPVSGNTAEFVNNVLENVEKGDRTGGLDMEDKDE